MNDGTAVNGIGGVSVLLHGGSVMNTWKDEMLDVSADSISRARASVMTRPTTNSSFSFEGRQMTPGVKGLTTAKEATS